MKLLGRWYNIHVLKILACIWAWAWNLELGMDRALFVKHANHHFFFPFFPLNFLLPLPCKNSFRVVNLQILLHEHTHVHVLGKSLSLTCYHTGIEKSISIFIFHCIEVVSIYSFPKQIQVWPFPTFLWWLFLKGVWLPLTFLASISNLILLIN